MLAQMSRVLGKLSFAYVDWDGSACIYFLSGSEPFERERI